MDQFTVPSGEPATLTDSAAVLDAEVNRLLQQAVERANSRVMVVEKLGSRWIEPGCNETRLYDALVGHLARSMIGQMESFAEADAQVARRRVLFEQSIYHDFDWPSSPTLVLTGRMAAVIRLAGVEMGTDKLGHFFTEGYSYFLVTEQLQKSVDSALLFGEWSEAVYFGAQTTGVFSYADLTANFQGLRFWNKVLADQLDPLTHRQSTPYIQCKDERWVQTQSFRWQDYVDSGWSEAVNCPVVRSEILLQRVPRSLVHCRNEQLPYKRYGAWQARLLNPHGWHVLPDQLQPEKILQRRVERFDLNLSADTLQYLGELRVRLEAWREEQSGTAAQP
ncbi:MAG TPA: hypothetical protein VM553_00905 [Dongiaceae bacterium]|nr:hypothetical protein [Dongiaceae bacterium]